MIKKINKNNFKPFGEVIEYSGKSKAPNHKNLFRIVLTEPGKTGWRIAYLVLRDKSIDKLEQHPDSLESFEPVKGKILLYVAIPAKPDKIECFLLDKPVILRKKVWHGVVTLGKEAEIKITENAKVSSIYRKISENKG